MSCLWKINSNEQEKKMKRRTYLHIWRRLGVVLANIEKKYRDQSQQLLYHRREEREEVLRIGYNLRMNRLKVVIQSSRWIMSRGLYLPWKLRFLHVVRLFLDSYTPCCWCCYSWFTLIVIFSRSFVGWEEMICSPWLEKLLTFQEDTSVWLEKTSLSSLRLDWRKELEERYRRTRTSLSFLSELLQDSAAEARRGGWEGGYLLHPLSLLLLVFYRGSWERLNQLHWTVTSRE